MSGQDDPYTGYTTTALVRSLSGFEQERRITDSRINQAIKTAEVYINDELNLSFVPYSATAVPDLIKEAALLMAIAIVRNPFPDDTNTYDKNWKLGLELLNRYKMTNQTASTAVSGDMALSDYNSDTLNPNAEADLTSKSFNTDYVPTFR